MVDPLSCPVLVGRAVQRDYECPVRPWEFGECSLEEVDEVQHRHIHRVNHRSEEGRGALVDVVEALGRTHRPCRKGWWGFVVHGFHGVGNYLGVHRSLILVGERKAQPAFHRELRQQGLHFGWHRPMQRVLRNDLLIVPQALWRRSRLRCVLHQRRQAQLKNARWKEVSMIQRH